MSETIAAKQNKKPLFKKRRSIEVKQRRYGYMFCIPFIIGAIIFIIYPMIDSILQSFADVKFSADVGLTKNFADPLQKIR